MKKNKRRIRAMGQILGVGGGFLGAGLYLLLHVWLPIQAERSLRELKMWQKQISQEKALFDQLNANFLKLTSLSYLDQWAKEHGPWKTPQKSDIVLVYD